LQTLSDEVVLAKLNHEEVFRKLFQLAVDDGDKPEEKFRVRIS
jgi:hypothetical protein